MAQRDGQQATSPDQREWLKVDVIAARGARRPAGLPCRGDELSRRCVGSQFQPARSLAAQARLVAVARRSRRKPLPKP